MRREVVERALPFPAVPGEQYHDHWLGLVAMTMGDVAYVDRPLYDYVQHGGAALGHSAANAGIGGRAQAARAARLGYWRGSIRRGRRRLLPRIRPPGGPRRAPCWPAIRGGEAGRSGAALRALRARRPDPPRHRLARAPVACGALVGPQRDARVETMLAESLLWRHVAPSSQPRVAAADRLPVRREHAAVARRARLGAPHPDPETAHIERLLEPLPLVLSDREPERVNLLIPTIDLQPPLRRLHRQVQPRPQARGGGSSRPDRHRRPDAAAARPTGASRSRPTAASPGRCRGSRSRSPATSGEPLAVSPDDRFVATTWWTAHHARDAIAADRAGRGSST